MTGKATGRARQRQSRQRAQFWRRLRNLRVLGIGGLLAGMVLMFIVVVAAEASVTGNTSHLGPRPDWVGIASTSPSDILAAARATRTYQDVANAPQTLLGQALQHGTLGTPVLVKVYHPAPGMSDVYVIPVLESSVPGLTTPGPHVVALLDFAYDAANHRMRSMTFAGPFQPGDPEYGQPFPRFSAHDAVAHFASAHPAALAANAQPQLVYFPVDLDKTTGPHPAIHWNAGGQFPDLAVWRMPTANNSDYLIGTDGQVYSAAQLPLAADASR